MYRIIGADGKEYGPVSAEQLRQWITEGRANADTRVALEGTVDWRSLGSVPEFQLLLGPVVSQPIWTGAPLPKNHGLAAAGMVMGILSVMLVCCCYGFPFNLLGVAFSTVALLQIQSHPEKYRGSGMAVAGIVLSILSFVLAAGLLAIGFVDGWGGFTHDHRF